METMEAVVQGAQVETEETEARVPQMLLAVVEEEAVTMVLTEAEAAHRAEVAEVLIRREEMSAEWDK